MINYVMVGSQDLEKAAAFYEKLLTALGASRAYTAERSIGWGWGVGTPMFIVNLPHDGQPAGVGNGSMVAFEAKSPSQVDELHRLALSLGGSDEGAPGPRGEHIYAGYCRDPDGNKFNFICYGQ